MRFHLIFLEVADLHKDKNWDKIVEFMESKRIRLFE